MKKLVALALGLALAVTGTTAAMANVFSGTPTVYIGYGAGGGTDTDPLFTPRRPLAPKLNCGPAENRQPRLRSVTKPSPSAAAATVRNETAPMNTEQK